MRLAAFSVVARSSIAGQAEVPVVDPVVHVQAWVADRLERRDGVRCIRRDRRRVVREDQDSGQGWVRAQDLGRDRLVPAPAWVVRRHCRLLEKRRGRHVRDRGAADGHATRRPKKAR
jgi:hypothetical protein